MSENWKSRIIYLTTAAIDADASPSEENEMLLETERAALLSAIAKIEAERDEYKLELAEAEKDNESLADDLMDWIVFAQANDYSPESISKLGGDSLDAHFQRLARKGQG